MNAARHDFNAFGEDLVFEEGFAAGAVGHDGIDDGQFAEVAAEFAAVFGGELAMDGRRGSLDAERDGGFFSGGAVTPPEDEKDDRHEEEDSCADGPGEPRRAEKRDEQLEEELEQALACAAIFMSAFEVEPRLIPCGFAKEHQPVGFAEEQGEERVHAVRLW